MAPSPPAPDLAGLLEGLFELTLDGVVFGLEDGTILRANPAACRLLGRTEAELVRLGRQGLMVDEPGLRSLVEARHDRGSARGLGWFRHADGHLVQVEMTSALLPGEAGPSHSCVIFREASGLREAEAALQASRRALRVLAGTSEAILRARGEVALFQEVCRVAVAEGGFRMAWAGVAEPGEGKPIRPVAWHGHEDGYLAQAHLTWGDEERGRGTAGIAMRTGRVAVANDIATDPRFAPWREAAGARGYASNAALPLVHQGERLGIMGFFSQERDAFTPEVIEVLQRIADDLAFGLAARRQRALAERTSAEVALATRLLGLEVGRLDLRTGLVALSPRARALRGLPAAGPDLTLEASLAAIDEADRPVPEQALAQARDAVPGAAELTPPVTHKYRLPGGLLRWIESCTTVVFDQAGQAEAVLSASIDVTDRVQEREQLRALTARVQQVREEEKSRIARDLHDDLGQALTALQLELRGAEALVEPLEPAEQAGAILDRLVAASALAGETIASVQRLSWSLRSEALERVGLDAALRQELRAFARRSGLAVVEAVSPPGDVAAPVATAAFRIAQEALTNVARHAGARQVEVRLEADGEELLLEIADDGRGIPPAAPGAVHLGLLGMQERAREFGGAVTITPREGGGTVVRARLPCSPRGPP